MENREKIEPLSTKLLLYLTVIFFTCKIFIDIVFEDMFIPNVQKDYVRVYVILAGPKGTAPMNVSGAY